MKHFVFASFAILLPFQVALAQPIETNAATIYDPPNWLTRGRAEKVINKIQTYLEWSIRRIPVRFHQTAESFNQVHSLGSGAIAVTLGKDQSVHLGPKVTNKNFDQVFGHELVHVILAQKHKTAIPKWIEEGLANHLAKFTTVNYQWLSQQTLPSDVRSLAHPFKGSSSEVKFSYMASQALAEMISRKCDLINLLRLSVGRNMETYLQTYCEIKDINKEFASWVESKSAK